MTMPQCLERTVDGLFRWPGEIRGLGPRHVAPLARCKDCRQSAHPADVATWCFYGDTPLCLRHAQERAKASS
jgi:hypothetical protein